MADRETKPIWNSSTFLVYTGGLTVLFGALAGLMYLSLSDYRNYGGYSFPTGYTGNGEMTAWALLFLVVLYGCALALLRRGRLIAAGIFAWVSVIAWAVFLIYLFRWFGWNPGIGAIGPYGVPGGVTRVLTAWSWSRMLFWILVLVAASYDRRKFRFPFIRLISAVVFWLFLVDLLTAGRGDWFAVLTLIVGVLYLLAGNVTDKPSAFWLHVVSGSLIGGVFFHWFSHSDGDYAVISIVAFVYVLVAYWTKRSSWAVLGALGFYLAAGHYVTGTPSGLLPYRAVFGVSEASTPWAPSLSYGLLGFFLVALGMLGRRSKGHRHAAVVVEKTVVVETPAE